MDPDQLQFFEKDFWPDLECVPMGVRFKLDSCKTKVSLRHWQLLSSAERAQLVALPCDSPEALAHFQATLAALATRYDFPLLPIAVDPSPWQLEPHCGLDDQSWQALSPFERFICIKAANKPELLAAILAALFSSSK
ncbi:nitrate reductase associated protein [Gloeobacter kilaueensis]|uniref:Uncharacterized protein n=1 Tax=Gloeobacter kilaueensis (strain ATCC BAA-2537 / CCAP 1431/1 / ULC 316 / JS1) TaxID=1183438 RepID=U5QEW2_GLOK1|nr:nitrate reductase associated protein [Gloeobacter kilaueensis]AGY57388.1 hypothetical protein GKIL_1142 [Gloeobacter kilaueensis JS1]